MADFDERMAHLAHEVGIGILSASCEVNQSYAQNQHETLTFRHETGRARFLGGPLLEQQNEILAELARKCITTEGSDVKQGMIEVSEKMARIVLENAPKDTGVLSTSGHPTVTDNDFLIYDRPPLSPREESKT